MSTESERRFANKARADSYDGTEEFHGTPSGYVYWVCRCDRCRAGYSDYRFNHYRTGLGIQRAMLHGARQRAKALDVACTIEVADVVVPEVCPVLGISLVRGDGKQQASSPSLDRIDSTKGYVPGNVQVLSYKANAMKSDATPEELLMFADWIYKTYRKSP